MKGINKTLPRYTGPNVSASIPQSVSTHSPMPPDSPPSLSIHPRGPKRSPLLAQCPWILRLLVAPPPRSLLTFLLPSPATFPWRIPQIPLLSQPIPRSVCDRPSRPSLVHHSMVLIHRDVNVIHQNLRLSLLSSRILCL